ncbi:MAG TPA: ribosome biogenesis GTPase Der [Pirellulaceae bacterium]|nr:ribosome biogenesis GTPase Der [Pirellulaceae bacterium]HMO92909.1 ribosome biogenesis GTPase Der [Pirellulaceae bacterium]HMP69187.1 ribosome biogenesis GTPase Der [Pirellulaceae bacterium]
MSVPQVAIIGRPNVGKSSLFNWLAGRRLAIVDDVAGVTRDRMSRLIQDDHHFFEIVDTGGIGINDVDSLDEEIEYQIRIGMELADVLLFLVDVRDGVTELDKQIAQRVRAIGKPVILVANKVDHEGLERLASEFFSMGFGPPICVSAQNRRNKSDLLQAIFDLLESLPTEPPRKSLVEPVMKLAIVGRRNVGKSTFVNALVNAPRMIVSEVAGTTRDSVDVHFEMDGQTFIAIDTPGLRKGKSVRTDIDWYGAHRAHRSIRFADVILMFFDAGQRVSSVDKKLCHYISDHHKPCILVVNKWDLMKEHMPTQDWADYLREQFSGMSHAPIAFITAKTGQNIKKLINHAQLLFKQAGQRVSTPQLNRIVKAAVQRHPPPMTSHHRRPKFFFATQIDVRPPTIVLKFSHAKDIDGSYQRYLLGILGELLPFGEVPIKLIFQERSISDSRQKARKLPDTLPDQDNWPEETDAAEAPENENDLSEQLDDPS